MTTADKKLVKKQDRRFFMKKLRNNLDCYLYLAPYGIIFFAFTVLPVLASIVLGFTNYNVLEAPEFVGIANYRDLLATDDVFILALKNTIIIAVITGPIGYLASIMFAWLINELSHTMRAIMVTVLYAPSISGGAYTIWGIIFSGDAYGWVNSMLLSLGIIDTPIQFTTDSSYMMPVLCLVTIWMSLGTGFLSNVAGFRTIDRSLYEAGYVEGIRNRWQELWFITLPQMKPMLMFSAVMSITQAFTVGDVGTTLFGFPSTDYATHTILNHIQDYGGTRFEMGYACATATILFVMMVACNQIIQKLLRKVGQ